MTTTIVAALASSYLLGAIPFGLLVGRYLGGVDPRTAGSHNIGATNVARTSGRRWGLLTLGLDAAKGAAVPAALRAGALGAVPHWLPAAAGLAAIVGHVLPVYLRFRGGKGVATAAGAFAALAPLELGIAFAVFAAVARVTRVVALGSLAAAFALVIVVFALDSAPTVKALAVVAAAIIGVRHRSNLRRFFSRGPRDP